MAASPSTTRARRADARLLHHVLDAPPQFGAAFSGERFSFTGQHYQVRGHAAGPMPAQRPHPPLMIGVAGPRLLVLAAREADIVTLCPRTRPTAAG